MPLFALANTGIILSSDMLKSAFDPNVLGIFFGLVFGKPIGIILFTWLGIKFGRVALPQDINLRQLVGIGFLAGIGFTMSVFITMLAFTDSTYVITSKTVILGSSIVAGTVGYFILRRSKILNQEDQALPKADHL